MITRLALRLSAAILIGAALFSHSALAEFGDVIEVRQQGESVLFTTSRGEVSITAVDDAAMEVHYRETDRRQLPSFAIADIAHSESVSLQDRGNDVVLRAAGISAVVQKAPLRIAFFRPGEDGRDEPLIREESGYFAYDTLLGFRFELSDDEQIMGGGERVLGMDRRGQRMPLYNRAHYGYETESSQMYYSVPAIVSANRYALIFDNSASGTLDIGHYEKEVLQFEASGGRTAYIVVAGDTWRGLMRNYTDVTGRQPLPPRYLFGNFASRFGYRNDAEVRDVVARFERERMPLDAVVLDLYWFGPDIQGHMGNLDWDTDAFPDGAGLIRDLNDKGIKTLLITEPFVLTASKRWQDAVDAGALGMSPSGDAKRFQFYFGETGLVDVFSDTGRDWFWQAYRRLFEQGVAGTWGDLGEPEVHPADVIHHIGSGGQTATADELHNAYGHEWARLVYENQRREFPDMRPAILMRAGFAGTQRYGIVPWTGDVSRSWGGLQPQVELGLQMSLLGLAYTHSDLGGFAGGERFDAELYLRWLQFGVFQPVFRPHAQEHIPPEPVFHDRRTRRQAAELLRLRYRMLPYNYSLAWENATTGMPLMRPLFFEDSALALDIDDQFLWGDAFLVAPITEPDTLSRPVVLPDGVWFDFWSGDRIVGGKTIDAKSGREQIPVFVRAGSFVPMLSEDLLTTANYSSNKLGTALLRGCQRNDGQWPVCMTTMADDPDSLRLGQI